MGVKLKICGVKTPAEAKQLKALGVDFIGLNFVPDSSRYISLGTAQTILTILKDSPIKSIALFQNQPLDMVKEYSQRLNVDYVQLHGDEPPHYADQIQTPIMRAMAVASDSSPDDLIQFIDTYPADYFVLDREVQGQGNLVDVELVKQVVSARRGKACLAGGLNPDNLASVIEQVQPFAIDISSGVRTGEDIDIEKVRTCLEIIRSARSSQL